MSDMTTLRIESAETFLKKRRAWLVVLATALLLAGGVGIWAQGSGSGAPAAEAPAGSPGDESEEELDTFVPTEEVGVDQAVDFPVDI